MFVLKAANIEALQNAEYGDQIADNINKLIDTVHGIFRLHPLRVGLFWHSKLRRKKTRIGKLSEPIKLRKSTPLELERMGLDYVMEVCLVDWTIMQDDGRLAMLDQVLTSLRPKFDKASGCFMGWERVTFDVMEFRDVYRRHGAWSYGLKEMIETKESPDLFGGEQISEDGEVKEE